MNNKEKYKRSNWFFLSGHVLTGMVLLFFLIIYLPVGVLGQFWKPLIFGPLTQLKHACTQKFSDDLGNTTLPTPITIPHGDLVKPEGFSNSLEITYSCSIPNLEDTIGGHIVHFGWVVGPSVTFTFNGQKAFHYRDKTKPTFHVNGGEQIEVVIGADATKMKMVGFVGIQPPVLTSNYADYVKVSGLDLFLKMTRPLNFLIPIISLSLVIGLSWLAGYRARILTMGMFVLSWSFLMRFFDLMTVFGLEINHSVSTYAAFRFGLIASLGLFIMEFARVTPKKIYPISRGIVVVVAFFLLMSGSLGAFIFDKIVSTSLNIFAGLFLFWIATYIIVKKNERVAFAKHDSVVKILCFTSGTVYFLEAVNIYFQLLASQMSLFLDTIFQLATAVTILLNFSRSERLYQAEKITSQGLLAMVAVAQAKQGLLSRFLSGRVMKKIINQDFVDHNAIDDNLAAVIAAKELNVAVIQADIRGFTDLFRDQTAEVIATVLKDFFGPVVKRFHDVAVIKLVGDCFFAFVEESDDPEAKSSPSDACIEIAAHLIKRMEELTAVKYANMPLSVGIGINFGKAMVGNISSDVCIDYTTIGSTINLAARLEELTKTPALKMQVGKNGTIIGLSAEENLKKYKYLSLSRVFLENGVRSFPQVKEVAFIRADNCLKAVFDEETNQSDLEAIQNLSTVA